MQVDKERLVKALRMQSGMLDALFSHEQRDELDFHVALAGALRPMLCDAQWPTLLKLAELLTVDLRVWGPHPLSDKGEVAPHSDWNALTVSAEPVTDSYEMSLKEFLDAPIGAIAIPDHGTGRLVSQWYTARNLIKWAANKEGSAHFDPKSADVYEAIGGSIIVTGSIAMAGPHGTIPLSQNHNALIRMPLLQIAQATLILANRLLAHQPSAEGQSFERS
jgi:hypothetical protein